MIFTIAKNIRTWNALVLLCNKHRLHSSTRSIIWFNIPLLEINRKLFPRLFIHTFLKKPDFHKPHLEILSTNYTTSAFEISSPLEILQHQRKKERTRKLGIKVQLKSKITSFPRIFRKTQCPHFFFFFSLWIKSRVFHGFLLLGSSHDSSYSLRDVETSPSLRGFSVEKLSAAKATTDEWLLSLALRFLGPLCRIPLPQ